MKKLSSKNSTRLITRSILTLRCLQIVTFLYLASSFIFEIQGNNKIETKTGDFIEPVQKKQSLVLNRTQQSRNSNSLSESKVRHRRQSTSTTWIIPPQFLYKETWSEHTTKLNRRFWTPRAGSAHNVFAYFDTRLYIASDDRANPDRGANWILPFTSQVWRYMTETYEQFGPDPYLYLTVHDEKDSNGVYLGYSVDPQNPNKIHFRNVLDIWYTNRDDWVKIETRQEAKDLIVNNLAYFVEKSYKDHFGSPSFNVWKGDLNGHTAWIDIFTYDVYKSLNWTNEAASYEQKVRNRFDASPKNTTFWFQEWFIPIYNNQALSSTRNRVLRNYFQLIYDYVPKNTDKEYTYNFNLGEFVHFWSGAANVSLKSLATEVFGWSEDLDREFRIARTTFSEVSKFYAYEAITKRSKIPPTTTTTPLITTQGYINNTTIADVTSKGDSGPESNEKSDKENANKNANNSSQNHISSDKSLVTIVSSVAGSIILVLIIVLIATYIFQKKKIIYLQADIRNLTNAEVDEFFDGDKNAKPDDGSQALVQYLPFVRDFEVERNELIVAQDKIIGSGQFGCVMRGFLQRSTDNSELMPVAVKTVKADVEIEYFKAMLLEAKIMAYLGQHPNIVRLLATYTANIKNHATQSVVIAETNVDEYSALNQITTINLLTWAHEISNGMMYLTEKKVIHGDLAARNVLLTNNRIANISDFGLSRQLLNYANYKKQSEGPLPWRWMAVESLNEMKFSVASDVWSFGITLWEIFSMSKVPYPCWKWDYAFVDRLISGERLSKPQYANQDIYDLMKDCWRIEPSERPRFEQINSALESMISQLASTQVSHCNRRESESASVQV